MSFIAKNPLTAPESKVGWCPTPMSGTRGLFPTPDGWKEIDSDGNIREIGIKEAAVDAKISEAVETLRGEVDGKADLSTMEEELKYKADISYVNNQYNDLHEYFYEYFTGLIDNKADKFTVAELNNAIKTINLNRISLTSLADLTAQLPEELYPTAESVRFWLLVIDEEINKNRVDLTDENVLSQIGFPHSEKWYPTAKSVYDYVIPLSTSVKELQKTDEYLQEQINEKPSYDDLWSASETLHARINKKADSPKISSTNATEFTFDFSEKYNSELRVQNASAISIKFANEAYYEDYISGLSFDSGETPTMFDYTDSGIINWVGTDCSTIDGLSIFQPSANTHYDIVFYFNGRQFIGLVNGFVPATGNVVSE